MIAGYTRGLQEILAYHMQMAKAAVAEALAIEAGHRASGVDTTSQDDTRRDLAADLLRGIAPSPRDAVMGTGRGSDAGSTGSETAPGPASRGSAGRGEPSVSTSPWPSESVDRDVLSGSSRSGPLPDKLPGSPGGETWGARDGGDGEEEQSQPGDWVLDPGLDLLDDAVEADLSDEPISVPSRPWLPRKRVLFPFHDYDEDPALYPPRRDPEDVIHADTLEEACALIGYPYDPRMDADDPEDDLEDDPDQEQEPDLHSEPQGPKREPSR